MAIPDYQTFMRPLLQLVADGGDHMASDVMPQLADQFHLTVHSRARDRVVGFGLHSIGKQEAT